MPSTILLGIIKAKEFTVYIFFLNHLVCPDCFKHSCKVLNFKSPFEGMADVGFTNITGKANWCNGPKMFSACNDNVIIFY